MKQAIIFRSDLQLGKGKIAAHAGHAAIEGYELVKSKDPKLITYWQETGQKKIVLKVKGEKELFELYSKVRRSIPSRIIRDAGLTQVKPGTAICLVIGPDEEEKIDKFTEGLKLL